MGANYTHYKDRTSVEKLKTTNRIYLLFTVGFALWLAIIFGFGREFYYLSSMYRKSELDAANQRLASFLEEVIGEEIKEVQDMDLTSDYRKNKGNQFGLDPRSLDQLKDLRSSAQRKLSSYINKDPRGIDKFSYLLIRQMELVRDDDYVTTSWLLWGTPNERIDLGQDFNNPIVDYSEEEFRRRIGRIESTYPGIFSAYESNNNLRIDGHRLDAHANKWERFRIWRYNSETKSLWIPLSGLFLTLAIWFIEPQKLRAEALAEKQGKPSDISMKAWNEARNAQKQARLKSAAAEEQARQQAEAERAKEILREEVERAKEILREKEQGDA